MLAALLLFAQEEAKKPTGGAPGSGLEIPLFLLVAMAMFWLIVLRPRQQYKEQQERERLEAVKKNDRVLVLNYIHGQIASVSDTEDEVVVKLDENFRVKFVKGAITRNFSQEERLKAAADAKAPPATASEAKDKVTPKKEGTA